MSSIERTPGTGNQNSRPVGSVKYAGDGTGSRGALAWAQFGLSALCVAGGAAIGLMVSVPLGIAVVTVAAGWQITIHIRP
ncbi:hypothetical protein ACFZCL_18365 [Streptomyces sp. NPDC008159]|uniref:hypothetical protein n=1 Tax=Streptomyces sp. NPDC008159 TaxID=3364817 RepID=UPI0036E37BBE